MRPGLDSDETRTESHLSSQAGRRLLLNEEAAEYYVVESWDVPGALIKSPNDPMFRLTMQQPPMSNGSYKSPGKVCVLRKALPGNPAENAQRTTWRDFWIVNWGWKKALAETSMFWTTKKNDVANVEVDNDDFLVTAPS